MPKPNDQSKRKPAESNDQSKHELPKRGGVTEARLRSLNFDDPSTARAMRNVSAGVAYLPDHSTMTALANLLNQMPLLDSSTMRAIAGIQSQINGLFANANVVDTLVAHLSSAVPRMDTAALASRLLQQIQLPDNFYQSVLAGLAETMRSMAAIPELSFSSATLSASLADTINAVSAFRLPETHPLLSGAILAPHAAMSNFVSDTQARLGTAENEQVHSALSGSLVLAEDQLLQTTAALESILRTPDDEDSEGPAYAINTLEAQQQELLARASVKPDASLTDLRSAAPAAGIAEQSRHVESLIVRCNESSELRGGNELFKPTTKMLWAYSGLPWIAATDDRTLGDFVDCLYWMLYEGGGGDSLRFLGNGLLTSEDCAAIWHLKHLRNYRLRHDPDHGSESDRRRKWKSLRQTLQALGLSDWPRSPTEYLLLQHRILQEVLAFLTRLAQAMSSQDD